MSTLLASGLTRIAPKLPRQPSRGLRATAEPVSAPPAETSAQRQSCAIAPPLTKEWGPELLGRATHELRSPLTLIYGHLEALQSTMFKGSAPIQKSLQVMDKHVRRMVRILDDLAIYGSLHEEEGLEMDQRFNLRACLEEVMEQLTPLLELRQPILEVAMPEVHLTGNRFCWDLVFNNLIERAIFSNASGPVRIAIKAERQSDMLKIKVSDDGAPIPEQSLPVLFQPFQCVCPGSQRDAGCTGLSLAIVDEAVRFHGGTLTVTSGPTQHTEFTISVPV